MVGEDLSPHDAVWLERAMNAQVSLVAQRLLRTWLNTVDPYPSAGEQRIFLFPTPATAWTVNHNLGKRPLVLVLDSGFEQLYGDNSWPTVNQFVVRFTTPQTGQVIVY